MMKTEPTKRRTFIKQAGLFSAAALFTPNITALAAEQSSGRARTILFQGDSITDGGRSYDQDWNHIMGQSFPYLISGRLWYDHPEQERMFLNRGISGNRIGDLRRRWQKDALDLKPDVISILVGVNDVFAVVKDKDPASVQQFRLDYAALIEDTRAALPGVKIVLCEPFILPVGQVLEQLKLWQDETLQRAQVVKELAAKYQATFVPLQKEFELACKRAKPAHWIWDGVHPMPAGHELIARQWIKTVKI